MTRLILFVLAVILINVLFSGINGRLDLTKDKRYTLTSPTKTLLKNLEGEVKIRVYLKGSELPAGFRHFAQSIERLLEEFRRYSGGRLQFEFVNPIAGVPDTLKAKIMDSLSSMGIQPYNVSAQQVENEGVSTQLLFPAALVDYNGYKTGVNLLQPQPGLSPEEALNHSTSLLEYNFSRALSLLSENAPPEIAYLLGNGETLDPSVYSALSYLDQNYRFDTLNLPHTDYISSRYRAVFIMAPTQAFSEADKLKIDQYVMNGGKILWAVNPIQASMDSLQAQSSFLAFPKELNLEDLLFTYGVRINPDIIQDLQSYTVPITVGQIGNRPQIQPLPWLYAPLLNPSSEQAITNNLDLVKGLFPSSMDTTKSKNVRKTTLLSTSKNSRIKSVPSVISLDEVKQEPNPRQFQEGNKQVAVLLHGHFPSVFKGRLNKEQLDQINKQAGATYRSESDFNSMIVVSDPNIFKNAVSQKSGPLPMGMDGFTREQFSNQAFFENCLTFLTDTTGIILSRNKEIAVSPLDKAKIKESKGTWTVLNFLIPILFVLLVGGIFQWGRKKRYVK